MATITRESQETATSRMIISADSHVHEPPDVWLQVPQQYRERAAQIGQQSNLAKGKPGGMDPKERVKEMEVDGVTAEVLYPTTGIRLYDIDDPPYQEALFRAYNDWLIDYCNYAPDRLVGLPALSLYNIEHAVKELERCRNAGLQGALVWLNPPEALPFTSSHYDPLWDACQSLNAPVNLHITLHMKNHTSFQQSEHDQVKLGINRRTAQAADALFDFLNFGILDRYPRLKVVLVELHIGWIPFMLQQWDASLSRRGQTDPEQLPSKKFERQVYATFIEDVVGGQLLSTWGQDNCMWSSDYPHPASFWPNSRESIEKALGHLDETVRKKIVHDNVVRLYPEALGRWA